MGFWEDRNNAVARQVVVSKSKLNPLRNYLDDPMSVIGLTVTCGMDSHRAAILQDMICRGLKANWPVIVLYSDAKSETAINQMLPFIHTQKNCIHPSTACYYGPLYGMNANQAKSVIIAGRENIGSQASDALSDLLTLLPKLGYEIHLDLLTWLASLTLSDMTNQLYNSRLSQGDQFYYSERLKAYYHSAPDGTSPISKVRDYISDFSNTLVNDLWTKDDYYDQVSILNTVAQRGFLAIGVNKDANSGAMRYLAKELTFALDTGIPFLLCCCDTTIGDNSEMAQVLKSSKGKCALFVSAESMPASFPGENNFWRQTLNLTGQLLVLKCSTPGSAEVYSDLFGQYVRQVVTDNVGSSWAPFGIFPGRHRATSISETLFPRITEAELSSHPLGGIFWPNSGDSLQICNNLNLRSDLSWGKT